MNDHFDPGAYVVRGVQRSASGLSDYTLVDMAGRVVHCAVPYGLTLDEYLHHILRAAVGTRRANVSR